MNELECSLAENEIILTSNGKIDESLQSHEHATNKKLLWNTILLFVLVLIVVLVMSSVIIVIHTTIIANYLTVQSSIQSSETLTTKLDSNYAKIASNSNSLSTS